MAYIACEGFKYRIKDKMVIDELTALFHDALLKKHKWIFKTVQDCAIFKG